MGYYLDGFKNGYEIASWRADMFFFGGKLPPENVKLSHKDLAEYGFKDWLKTTANPTKPDYFILRNYVVNLAKQENENG